MAELGLFPLGIVLLPSEHLPLHIFEERYKQMIGECLDEEREFGIVWLADDALKDIGCAARITRVLERFDDGRLNVVVEGGERFRLDELTDGRPFHTGEVSPVEDEDDPADAASIDEAIRLFGVLREVTESEVDAPESDAPQLSYVLAGKVELPAEVKLELLREVSERRRIELVQDLLEKAALTAQRVRRAAERASTNGRVDLG